jgi:CIC family chloride channel protein
MAITEWLRSRYTANERFLTLAVICGLVCGLVAVSFHLAIHFVFEHLWGWASGMGGWKLMAVMFFGPTLAGLAVGLVTTFWVPEAVGSGIPQTKEAYYNKGGVTRTHVGFWRFTLGTLYIGLGNSLGREGPTVHMCSAVASRLGRWMFKDPARVQSVVPVGMAAGIGAAFNAPLSAITFVFEELLDNFSMKALGSIVVAVVLASAVARTILGDDPVLSSYLDLHYQTSLWMLVAIPLGLVSGLFGHLFVSSVLRTRQAFKRVPMRMRWMNPMMGGASCGVLGLAALMLTGHLGAEQHSVFSIGYESLELAFEAKLAVAIVAVLLGFKFVAVVLCYASGGSGGLFSPTLFLGGMLGGLVGACLVALDGAIPIHGFPGAGKVIGGCVLLGMGSLFGAVVRCPMTSLLIIFEMTGNYSLILPLMAGNMLSWGVARKLRPLALYDSLLVQDGVNLRRLPAYRGSQDYQFLPVAAIMTHEVCSLRGSASAAESVIVLDEFERKHRSYVVCDDEGGLVGMVAAAEIRAGAPEALTSSFVKGRRDFSVFAETSIMESAKKMIDADVRQVPVVSSSGGARVLGIITLNDIARQQNEVGL